MPYIANTEADQQEMLRVIGVDAVDRLFDCIPEALRRHEPLDVPPALTELELAQHVAQLAHRDVSTADAVCFLGGGSYDHFVPAVVDMVAARNEFYTAYTPYQPEASQGSLQAFFEFQTLLCQITGMDVANASLYDGASAAAEAAFMAIAQTGRSRKVVVPTSLHPDARQVLATYLANLETELVTVPAADGATDLDRLAAAVDDQTACVIVQHPNFFGCLEDMRAVAEIARRRGALFVASVDPISLGLLERPGNYGADIVIAEGQSLGIPLQFGGPYLGIIACREAYVRKLPGRIVGQTTDRHGHRTFVLTLQTREQHIRREKATSNICTNQGLLALRATAYLAALGPQGLHQVADLCFQKAHYAAEVLAQAGGELYFARPFFKEFCLRLDADLDEILARLRAAGYLAGLPLGRWYPQLADGLLVAVTESRTRREIDGLARAFQADRRKHELRMHPAHYSSLTTHTDHA
jgi:glycine dehydrogenase subunit 1